FSSRRRHTRCLSDWSSDVCSSDLVLHPQNSPCGCLKNPESFSGCKTAATPTTICGPPDAFDCSPFCSRRILVIKNPLSAKESSRSEERRVGKECRYQMWRNQSKKK